MHGTFGWYTAYPKNAAPDLPTLAEGDKIRFHDLRHTAVSRMVTAKILQTTIAKIVGWSKSTTAAMAARYAHPDMNEMMTAMETISAGYPQNPPQLAPEEKPIVN